VDLFFFREQRAFTTTSQDGFEQKQRCRLFLEGVSKLLGETVRQIEPIPQLA
jgi:hypothetical protein